jgi:hypothetical protein
MKEKTRSLFKAVTTPALPAAPNAIPAHILERFASDEAKDSLDVMHARMKALAAAGAVNDLEVMLGQMDKLADKVVEQDRIERASEYAAKIRDKMRLVRLHVAGNNADLAALESIRLMQLCMELGADEEFAGPVWEKVNREAALPKKATDDEIRAALDKHPTQEKAAESLKLSPRQLRRRITAMQNRTS